MNCFICGRETTKKRVLDGELRYLCGKHIAQLNFRNGIGDKSSYSIADKNESIETDEGIWVICRNAKSKEHEETGRFLVSKEDKERVLAKKWRCWKSDYFTGSFHPINIARFIMEAKGTLEYVDHINGNRADNRRENLRLVTPSENNANRHIFKHEIAGIYYDKSREAYAVDIRYCHKRYRLGRWKELRDAVYCRFCAEMFLFGDYRCQTNDIAIEETLMECTRKEEIEQFVKNKISHCQLCTETLTNTLPKNSI